MPAGRGRGGEGPVRAGRGGGAPRARRHRGRSQHDYPRGRPTHRPGAGGGGRRFLDAPVSGAPAGAEAGTLTVMCGGDADAFEAVRPLLDRFGATVLHMGPAGAGQLTKTVNNVLYDINIAALAEVLPMAVAMGLDPAQLGQVVTTGTSRSYASQYFVPRILRGEFDQGYPLAKAYKDLVSAATVAAEHGFPSPSRRRRPPPTRPPSARAMVTGTRARWSCPSRRCWGSRCGGKRHGHPVIASAAKQSRDPPRLQTVPLPSIASLCSQ
ncbi:NAD(P)-dependent oxidoreductase [Methylobacterium persicinum]